MNALAFDTLAVARRLKAAGFSQDQAEAVTGVLQDASRIDLSDLATKTDLANLATKAELANLATKAELANLATKAELANLATKAELANLVTKAELADAKYDILKWVLSAIGFQAIVVVGAIVAVSKGVR